MTSAKATIHASKPFVKITYREPTTKANGETLDNLVKTTIYYDLGKGWVKYKDIPASNPHGGGKVPMEPKEFEEIPFSISQGTTIQATICVTATNTHGQESK